MFSLMRQIGNNAEKIAKKYLTNKGLIVVKTNFLTKIGEIDLIMLDDEVLAFIEVRYRKNANFSSAIATINKKKQLKIMQTADIFLQQNSQYQNYICRFDVIGINGSLKYPNINYITNAFTI